MPPILKYIRQFLSRHIVALKWQTILLSILSWASLSWGLLDLAGEHHITRAPSYVYWLIITSSSTGYGDLYPQALLGQYVTALLVIPVGFSLFAIGFGRAGLWIVGLLQKRTRGLSKLKKNNHIVVIGWRDKRTIDLLQLLSREEKTSPNPREIVLCVEADIENPLPGEVSFSKVQSVTDDQEMDKACITQAHCIIVDNPEDDATMTTALYCQERNPGAHTIVYFKDEVRGSILKKHCPSIECMPSVAIEMMAKSAVDPGSSRLHQELLSVSNGETQYSIVYPETNEAIGFESIFIDMKRNFKATIIGISTKVQSDITINPDLDSTVQPGSILYYIADERIKVPRWKTV